MTTSLLDDLLDDANLPAITYREEFEPVDGRDGIFFPPTFAGPENGKDKPKSIYNYDRLSDGTLRVTIDTIPSQANRMEPVFEQEGYKDLVPRIDLHVMGVSKLLTSIGHRAADAAFRLYSDMSTDVHKAILAANGGDHRPLAKIAPTSLVFGMWDSRPDKDDNRTTHFKAPRLITSRIDAYGVDLLTKNGAFIPSVTNDDLHAADRADDAPKLSSLGLAMVPIHGLGGARLTATGRILRQVTINIVNARALRPHGGEGLALRRYILGLTLVAATAPQEAYLRQGCLLVRTEGPAPQFTGVYRDGTRRPLTLDHGALLAATRAAAAAFGVGEDRSASFSNVSVPKEVKKRGKAS